MSASNKPLSEYDFGQVIRKSYNDNGTLGIDSWLVGKVNRKITKTNVDDVTEDYTFTEDGTTMYVFRIIYVDSSKEDLLSAERIS